MSRAEKISKAINQLLSMSRGDPRADEIVKSLDDDFQKLPPAQSQPVSVPMAVQAPLYVLQRYRSGIRDWDVWRMRWWENELQYECEHAIDDRERFACALPGGLKCSDGEWTDEIDRVVHDQLLRTANVSSRVSVRVFLRDGRVYRSDGTEVVNAYSGANRTD